jgi:hypothetical protein
MILRRILGCYRAGMCSIGIVWIDGSRWGAITAPCVARRCESLVLVSCLCTSLPCEQRPGGEVVQCLVALPKIRRTARGGWSVGINEYIKGG